MPRGAYANARTFRRDAVFQFAFHMEKLANSITLMRQKEEDEEQEEESVPASGGGGGGNLTPPPTPGDVERVVRPLLTAALTRHRAEFPAYSGEVKLCVHVAWGDNPTGRGLHSSTFQLNLSCFWHKIHLKYPLTPPKHPLHTPCTPPKFTTYPTESAYFEPRSGRV
jgi:hypothetical protein